LEISIALMFAGYIGGNGIVGIMVELRQNLSDAQIKANFYWAAIAAFFLFLLTIYLSRTSLKKMRSKF